MKPIEKLLIPISIIILLIIIPFSVFVAASQLLYTDLNLSSVSSFMQEYEIAAVAAVFALLTVYAFLTDYIGSHRIFYSVYGLVLVVLPFFNGRLLSQFQSEVVLLLAVGFLEAAHAIMIESRRSTISYMLLLLPTLAVLPLFPFYYLEFVGYAILVCSFFLFGSRRNMSVTELNLRSIKRAAPKTARTRQARKKTATAPTAAASTTSPAAPAPVPAPVPVSAPTPPAHTPAPPAQPASTAAKQEEKPKKSHFSLGRSAAKETISWDDVLPPSVPWPGQSDYAKAIQNLDFSIAPLYPEVKGAKVLSNPFVKIPGNVVYSSGNYGTIFKLQNNGSSQALKCFTRSKPDLAKRYYAISKQLKAHEDENLAFVDFQYLPKAIRTFRNPAIYFPVLTMQWIEGTNLNVYISEQVKKKNGLDALASNFLQEMIKIRNAGIAHGDIAGDNIVISDDGKLTLVDYDGLYVPEFRGLKAEELGHDHFQHPARSATTYSARLDNFSILVTYLSLLAVSEDPKLWSKYNKGDQDCLIFRKDDFVDPSHSGVINDLTHMKGRVGALTGLLNDAISHDPLWQGADPQAVAKLQ